jgi:hypothetical protein
MPIFFMSLFLLLSFPDLLNFPRMNVFNFYAVNRLKGLAL